MKLGLIDVALNKLDVREAVEQIFSSQAGNQGLSSAIAPDLLKIPACAKSLFSQGCDVILVYINAGKEDLDAIALIQEKLIDVETEFGKFVFLCIVFDEECKTKKHLQDITDKRLNELIEFICKIIELPQEIRVGQEIPSSIGAAFNLFAKQEPSQPEEEEATGLF